MTEEQQKTEESKPQQGYIDPASLAFSGRVVIKDAETGEVLVDKRSE